MSEDEDEHQDTSLATDDLANSTSSIVNVQEVINNSVYVNSDGEEYTAEEIELLPSLPPTPPLQENEDENEPQQSIQGLFTFVEYAQPTNTSANFTSWGDLFASSIMQQALPTISPFSMLYTQTGTTAPIPPDLMSSMQLFPPAFSPLMNLLQIAQADSNTLNSEVNILNRLNELNELDEVQELNQTPRRILRPIHIAPRRRRRRRFFTEDEPNIITTNNNFNDDQYDLAASYLNSLLWELRITQRDEDDDENQQQEEWVDFNVNILNVVLEYYTSTNEERMPTLPILIHMLVEDLTRFHTFELPYNHIFNIVEYWVTHEGFLPHPNDYEAMYEYHLLHARYPSQEELDEFTRRTIEFFLNPEAYHQHDKIHVPALNVDKIVVELNQETGKVCCVCQDDIEINQRCLKLPPCQHIYHADAHDCLENGTIYSWLAQHNTCPMCKTKVMVNTESEE